MKRLVLDKFLRSLLPALALLTIIGCATLEQLAPPLPSSLPVGSPAAISLGSISDATLQQAKRGRQIYITECRRCHSPEPVTGYSQVQWDEILPRMAKNSKLPPEKMADIARALGENVHGVSTRVAAERGVAAVRRLLADIQCDDRLSRYGVTEEQLNAVADTVFSQHQGRSALSPHGFSTRDEVMELLRKAY